MIYFKFEKYVGIYSVAGLPIGQLGQGLERQIWETVPQNVKKNPIEKFYNEIFFDLNIHYYFKSKSKNQPPTS